MDDNPLAAAYRRALAGRHSLPEEFDSGSAVLPDGREYHWITMQCLRCPERVLVTSLPGCEYGALWDLLEFLKDCRGEQDSPPTG